MAITTGFFLMCIAAVETHGRFSVRVTFGLDYFLLPMGSWILIFCFCLGKMIGNIDALSTRQKLLANVLWLNTQIQLLEYVVVIHWGDANGRERLSFTHTFPFECFSPLLRLMMVPWGVKS